MCAHILIMYLIKFIFFRLWNATLVSDYPKVDLVKIASRAKIHIPTNLIIHQDTSDDVAQVLKKN